METIQLRPGEPGKDFAQLAEWFSLLESEASSETGLAEYYAKNQEQIIQQVAETPTGELLGFFWIKHYRPARRFNFYLFVKPEQRKQGLGSQLLAQVVSLAQATGTRTLRISLWDTCPECLQFAEGRGFRISSHLMAMALELEQFDDLPYTATIARLQGEGFRFTSMAELGNTEAVQRKLYALNDMTSMETPGSSGEHAWETFEEFQTSVCQSDWYRPDGQMVVIDTASGEWVGMSAITRFGEHGYNLHTGVDKRYRGRKIAQAVKVLALRYAREVLQVKQVQTHHNSLNLPMLAIDRKFGYVQTPGFYVMEKEMTAE